ncbi:MULTISPECIES: DUF192 domain-containing protein [Haloferax]|uniref:DUF192 family protein n=6 Tax=Haloferax TaxID=2251 RepID=D4GSQ4_HALVD|nr:MULTISPECIES: DUF192 domain-containing protein [Haloferax]MBC9985443.1 DUF192 domain-containing protein [Haloferax sp. AS1]ADE04205.1 DUF192 family protein [Haloferax volcanii DS2]ELY26097.1 hypothetical protein C498_15505 [Haloferax volcanii DS2]ELZ71014.1 hypothetical protein C456_15095 [Haloferax lucentense DSM 14919]ELZ92483.1 hypothetical protein C452_07683 [Haloferax alexandrinus JCM 10717]
MRLVHRQNGAQSTLASNVETADSFLSQARGLMFRGSVPDDYALVFRFDDADRHSLHMVFVPFDIDALWLVGDEVTKKKRLSAWTGIGFGMADTVVELPAGAADGVEPGDLVEIAE